MTRQPSLAFIHSLLFPLKHGEAITWRLAEQVVFGASGHLDVRGCRLLLADQPTGGAARGRRHETAGE